MEGIGIEYDSNSINPEINEKSEFNSYIIDDHKKYASDSHDHMFHLLKKYPNQEY